VATALHSLSAGSVALLPFTFLLQWLLLRGGRVVWWFLIASDVLGVIGVAWGESVWWAVAAGVGLPLLLAPASRRYVWKEATLRRTQAAANQVAYGWGARLRSGLLWQEMWSWIGERVVNWKFIGRLALVVVAAYMISGSFFAFRHDGLLVGVPWRIADVIGGLGLILLLCLLIAIGIRTLARRIRLRTRAVS
jgi:hypothetical protein